MYSGTFALPDNIACDICMYMACSAILGTFISSSTAKPSDMYSIIITLFAKSLEKENLPNLLFIVNTPFTCASSGCKPYLWRNKKSLLGTL